MSVRSRWASAYAGAAGRLRLRPRDVALAAAVALVQIGITAGAIAHHRAPPHPACWWGACAHSHLDTAAYVLLALGPIALLVRRLYPRAVLAVVFAVTVVYAVSGYPAGPVFLSLIIAFATVVGAGARGFAWATIVAGWGAFLWLPSAFGTGHPPRLTQAAGLGAWLLVLMFGAEMVRGRRERLAAQRRTREEEGLRRAEEERLRIARELHDVLAHNISLINVQSGVALHLLSERPEQARTALSVINEASADALREMRSVLGVLRGVDESAPRSPTPGLSRLDELLAHAEAAGVTVRARTGGHPRALPTAVDLAAYRIVQESLTNVARHAGGGHATVALDYGLDALTVEIVDDGVAAVAVGAGVGTGNGIAGMRERATALGGGLDAGPRPEGGFRVRARLPYAEPQP